MEIDLEHKLEWASLDSGAPDSGPSSSEDDSETPTCGDTTEIECHAAAHPGPEKSHASTSLDEQSEAPVNLQNSMMQTLNLYKPLMMLEPLVKTPGR